MNVIDALVDQRLFGGLPAFREVRTWRAWCVFLCALHGLPLREVAKVGLSEAEALALFCRHTGRTRYVPPVGGWPEAAMIVGVQSGKSQTAALLAGHAAITGARGTHALLIGQDFRGAIRSLFRYAVEPFEQLDVFRAEVVRTTADTIELRNGVTLSAYPCRPPAIRGLRACIVVVDELAFFTATDGRPVDVEMLRAARGRVATTDGKVVVLSSPYAAAGALYDLHRRHYGRDDAAVLVWQASAPEMNPRLPANYLERMAQDDPEAYQSEVLGQFRAGLSTLFDPEAVAACVDAGVRERAPQPRLRYSAFVDAASGSGKDAFAVAVAHLDGPRAVLDALRTWKPPFNPTGVIAEAADVLKSYGLTEATGDAYAAGFVVEGFRGHGITYRSSVHDRTGLYLSLLPHVNAAQVVLLEHADLVRELRGLERRRGTSGRDRIDHRVGAHDDAANAAAGALTLAIRGSRRLSEHETLALWQADDIDPRDGSAPLSVARVNAAIGAVGHDDDRDGGLPVCF